MTEIEILNILRTAPAVGAPHHGAMVERAAHSLVTMARRLSEEELEAMIELVAMCYHKMNREDCEDDEFVALMQRLAKARERQGRQLR